MVTGWQRVSRVSGSHSGEPGLCLWEWPEGGGGEGGSPHQTGGDGLAPGQVNGALGPHRVKLLLVFSDPWCGQRVGT